MPKQTKILLITIVALAALLRFSALDRIPPGIYPDEAMNGMNSLTAWATSNPLVFYPDNNGREGLFMNVVGISLRIWGINQFGLRFPSALAGVLTVLGIFFLTRELIGKERMALLAAYFVATSYWHINFSRISFRAILVPLVLSWGFYFLLRAFRKVTFLDFLASGLIFGVGFHTYIAFRIFPLLFLVFAILRRREIFGSTQTQARVRYGITLMLAAAFTVILPMGLYFFSHRADFLKRDGAKVGVFEQEEPFYALGRSIVQTALMFNFRGDCNWRHNLPCRPQVSPLVSVFFLTGLWLAVRRLFKKTDDPNFSSTAAWLLLFWFAIFLLPEVLTAEGIPHALRAIGAIPPVYIFSAIGFSAFWTWFTTRLPEDKKWMASALAIVLLAVGAIFTVRDYFVVWAKSPTTAREFTRSYTHIAEYLRSLPMGIPAYIVINQGDVKVGNTSVHAQAIKFPLYAFPRIRDTISYIDPAHLEDIPSTNPFGSIIIPLKADDMLFRALQDRGFRLQREPRNDFEVWKVE